MKKDFINLSIIIPVYNEENTLLDVLKNIKKLKNFCNLEIIVVNDGSTDKTSKVIEDNKELPNMFDIILTPDIYVPIIGMIILVLVGFIIRKKFYK